MSECGGRGGGGGNNSEDAEDEGGGPKGSGSLSPAGAAASLEGRIRRGLRGASLMARQRPELLCGAVALGCALLFALKFTCSRAKDVIIPAKPPVSFFSSRSPVLDLFQGQLDYADHVRQDSEVVVLFFYAPWCGQSIAARAEIEQAASRLSDQVLFVAINCWWNQGKCRKQKHFFYFPVIHLYHRSFGPIEYKGPMSAVYIEKFVRRAMKPLLYIPSQSALLDFLSSYEVFPREVMNFTAENIYKWASENQETLFRWLQPHEGKSLLLNNELKKGPALFLFIPFDPLAERHPLLDEITEVALEYNNCHGDQVVERLLQHLRRVEAPVLQSLAPELPASLPDTQLMAASPCCNTVVLPQGPALSRTHNVCELCVNQTVGGTRPSSVSVPQCSFFEMAAALDPKQALMKFTLESFIQNFSVLYSPLKRHLTGSDSAQFPTQHLITEVTTDTFWEVTLRKQDVLLLYYTQWCGFCPSLNHIFIQLARLLPEDTFTVARIDVSQNDLPWEFMVDRLPTVLFFPCNRKDLSVKYPGDLPITLPNLLRFILHHSDAASAPQDPGISPPTQDCVQSKAVLQREHISHVENAMQKLRSEMSSLRRTQEQVEGRLLSARRDGHRLLRRQRTLEQQHRLLRRHSQKLQALYLKKARELQELARASGTPLPEHTWLKILVATMERELEGQGGAKEPAPLGKARPNHSKSMGTTQLPGDTPPPSTTSSTLASETKHENRTD